MSTTQAACWRPFDGASPVNAALPANPQLAADNGAIQQHFAQYGWSLQNYPNQGFSLHASDGDRPVYFANASDPVMTVRCTDEEGLGTCQGGNHVDVNGVQIHVPAGAQPTPNWDAHMVVIETDTGQEYDFWHTSVSGSTLTAGTGSEENVDTSQGTADDGDAANLALSAGLLRPSELASGHIHHALVMTVPCTDASGANVGYAWPATGGWGQYCGQFWNESATGAPAIGQLFKLNMTATQIAASGAPAWERTIMTALATYGAYAEDTNGSWHDERMSIITQDPISWTSLGQANQWTQVIRQLGGQGGTLSSAVTIPPNKLEAVAPCVPQGTCVSTGATGGRVAEARVASFSTSGKTRARARRHRHARHAPRKRHSTRPHPRHGLLWAIAAARTSVLYR